MVTTFSLTEEQIQVLEESIGQGKAAKITPHEQVMEEVNELLRNYQCSFQKSQINARDKQKANQ
ncbi:hypothetical protein [Capnocytophaga haemolytica]